MVDLKEKVLEIGKIKSIRENRVIRVYFDENSKADYYISPIQIENKPNYKLIEKFGDKENQSLNKNINEIEDYKSIKENDQILIDGENSNQVKNVTKRQIHTFEGNKFRRSDGKQWGAEEGEETKQITHKINL